MTKIPEWCVIGAEVRAINSRGTGDPCTITRVSGEEVTVSDGSVWHPNIERPESMNRVGDDALGYWYGVLLPADHPKVVRWLEHDQSRASQDGLAQVQEPRSRPWYEVVPYPAQGEATADRVRGTFAAMAEAHYKASVEVAPPVNPAAFILDPTVRVDTFAAAAATNFILHDTARTAAFIAAAAMNGWPPAEILCVVEDSRLMARFTREWCPVDLDEIGPAEIEDAADD